MLDPRATRFWLAAQQSGLMDVQGLNACWEAIPTEKREVLEHLDRRLARQSVQQSFLTLWQAQQLLAGRTSGFRVDRYLLLDLIGHGGMGRVYLARDTRLNRLVALKILAPERMNNPRAIARFQREARVGAQLQHEHLVRIYDFGESSGRYYLVMEYIEGKTIGTLISAQGPMPAPTAARLTRQIALGLEHAHRKGLIHRDVNPYNILVTHDGVAKLADLGLAIDLAEEDRVTREGATVGTFDYVAPEQARHSHSADIRSDIYSLGCTLYHMIAGQVPFPSPSLPEKLFAHQALEPTPLNQLVPTVPPGLVEVVQRMMRKLPEERYGAPLQVAQALTPFVEDLATLKDGEPGPEPLIPEQTGEATTVASSRTGEAPTDGAALSAVEAEPGFAERLPAAVAHVLPTGSGRDTGVASFNSEMGEGHQTVVAPSMLTPVNDAEVGSEEDVPLFLDLGPEPSLADSLTRPRSWFMADRPGKPAPATLPEELPDQSRPGSMVGPSVWTEDRLWRWAIAGLIVILAMLLIGLVISRWLQMQAGIRQDRRGAASKSEANLRSPRAPDGSSERRATPGDKGLLASAITVLAEDGVETPAQDLLDAIQRAIGAKGWVVFHNRTAMQLPSGGLATSSATKEWVKLRAAEGVNPVLEVELKERRPFLTVGSGMNLIVEGLTIVARSPTPAPTDRAAGSIILTSGGAVQFRHCAFETGEERSVAGTRAVVVDGGNLTVENCWFKGFDAAFEVRTSRGSTTVVRQTMVIPAGSRASTSTASSSDPASTSLRAGWGLRLELMGGGRTGAQRRLVLDHCTVMGAGLLQLVGFSATSPLHVEAKGCAVRTMTLVGWEPDTSNTPFQPEALHWKGDGNQFDVSGPSWILQSAKALAPRSSPIVSLDNWSQIATERAPIVGGIEFSIRPEAQATVPQPRDFAIKSSATNKAGADPEQVGPERPKPSGSSGS
jgi:serine/threonine-protein kinase